MEYKGKSYNEHTQTDSFASCCGICDINKAHNEICRIGIAGKCPGRIYYKLKQGVSMKYEIYQKKPAKKKVIRLKLVETGGAIRVYSVTEDGVCCDAGHIISFNYDGTLYRNPQCNVPGIRKDSLNGRIKLSE